MTITTENLTSPHIDPTELPCGPDRVQITPLRLAIKGVYASGAAHDVHLIENGDLHLVLDRGQRDTLIADPVPHGIEDTNLIVIALGVDGDHDEVHYSGRSSGIDTEEVLAQAFEALVAGRHAVRQITRPKAAQ